jgi:hypothetical protein
MKLYRAGDRSAGVCESCRRRVVTRMEYRDYTPPGWDETVPDVLVAACETCGEVVGVPHQSTPKINDHRKERPATGLGISVEARVPREIAEALDLVTVTLGGSPRTLRPAVLRYYFAQVATRPIDAQAVKRQCDNPAPGPLGARIVVKLTARQWARVSKASKAAGITKRSDLIRGAAMLAAEDCRIVPVGRVAVVDKDSRRRHRFLKRLAETI